MRRAPHLASISCQVSPNDTAAATTPANLAANPTQIVRHEPTPPRSPAQRAFPAEMAKKQNAPPWFIGQRMRERCFLDNRCRWNITTGAAICALMSARPYRPSARGFQRGAGLVEFGEVAGLVARS